MFFYKQRENSQKMHVFVQRPQKKAKKREVPSELTRPGATGFEPAQIKRRFVPKSPLVLCGKRTKKHRVSKTDTLCWSE